MADNYIRSLNGYKLKDEIARDQIANLQASLDDHNHDDSYETKTDASSKLAEAKSYTDSEVAKVTSGTIVVKEAEHAESADSATTATTATTATNANHANTADSATSATTAGSATKATQDGNGKVIADTYETKDDASSKLNDAKSYADNAATTVKNDLLNGAGAAYDTLKELGALIDTNTNAIDALETVATGKADKTHSHSISEVANLQSTLDALKSDVDANESNISSAQTKLATIEEGAQKNVQPDWNENDPESAAYIKNRTHWLGEPVETALIENVEVKSLAIVSMTIELDTTYNVIWDDNEYECVSSILDTGEILFGNASINANTGNDTGEPFLAVMIEAGTTFMLAADTTMTHTMSVSAMLPEVHKIEERFLPSGAVVGAVGVGDGSEIFNGYESNEANGVCAHSEGWMTKANGSYSHAEGFNTEASGHYGSHAEGLSTKATGECGSHAEGELTEANGDSSHAEGVGTIANGIAQHAQGKYNIEDVDEKYAHIVGNGSNNNGSKIRSNAHTLDWDGNAWYQGTIKVGGTSYDDASEVALKSDIPEGQDLSVYAKKSEIPTDFYSKSYVDEALSKKADTSSLTSHTGNGDIHVTAAQKSNWDAAYGHSQDAHKYAGSSSKGGAANSVANSMTIKLNGGSTEGTNMFTFNGSAAKSINITPASIGAQASGSYAAASHNHDDKYYTEAEIDSKVSTLNTAINGKAASSHTHSISDISGLEERLAAIEAMLISITDSEIDSICGV